MEAICLDEVEVDEFLPAKRGFSPGVTISFPRRKEWEPADDRVSCEGECRDTDNYQGYRDLLSDVMLLSVDTLKKFCSKIFVHRKRLDFQVYFRLSESAAKADHWLMCRSPGDDPFAFVNICDSLDLDPDEVRRRILNQIDQTGLQALRAEYGVT